MNEQLIEKMFEDNPHATLLVQSWFMSKLVESLDDQTVPEDFREMLRQQGVSKEQLVKMIGGAPRALLDVFDENEIFIQINATGTFSYSINQGDVISGSWNTRKEAEYAAVQEAFKILEAKIKES